MRNPLVFLVPIGFFVITACGPSGKTASLKLTNAIEADSATFPAVVQLMAQTAGETRYCTGFFINEHQLVTAAHCVQDLDSERPESYLVPDANSPIQQRGARALRYFVHPNFTRGQQPIANPYDLAVLDFPAGSARETLRLSLRAVRVNDSITLVGFGNDQNTPSSNPSEAGQSSGTKRYGQNSIKTSEAGILSLIGVPATRPGLQKGQYVATAQGDSGGPILRSAEVVGMTIAGEIRKGAIGQVSSVSYAIDLVSESSREFLDSIID